jgi:hypothetical protein
MLRSVAWLAPLAALACFVAATTGRADGRSNQPVGPAEPPVNNPWPASWPIVPPPIRGPLPPEPPRAPPSPPATQAAHRVMDVIDRVGRNLRDTRYQHQLLVRERNGIYRWDCSLMVAWMLQRAAPRALRQFESLPRALAHHFVRAIERSPTEGYRQGWQRVPHIADARAGDVFAWRRPPGFPSRNSGHVGFVLEAPRPVPRIPNAWAVLIADATSIGHQNDSRPTSSEGGFGIGTLVFLADDQGRGTHYGWAGTYSSGYVVTPIHFGRVGP